MGRSAVGAPLKRLWENQKTDASWLKPRGITKIKSLYGDLKVAPSKHLKPDFPQPVKVRPSRHFETDFPQWVLRLRIRQARTNASPGSQSVRCQACAP